MDDIFRTAEERIENASSGAELKGAIAKLLVELFSSRPATRAYMAQQMMRMMDMHGEEEFEKKRQSAKIFINFLEREVNLHHKAS